MPTYQQLLTAWQLAADETSPSLAEWAASTERLLTGLPAEQRVLVVRELTRCWCWTDALEATAGPRQAQRLAQLGVSQHWGPRALAHLLDNEPKPWVLSVWDARLDQLGRVDDPTQFTRALLARTETLAAAVATLRDGSGVLPGRLRTLLPEVAALAVEVDPALVFDRDRPSSQALLDHLHRALARKLLGLETGDHNRFQEPGRPGLSPGVFAAECDRWAGLSTEQRIALRAALIHLDFAKGGTPEQRQAWQNQHHADLSIHNLAAAEVLRRTGRLERLGLPCDSVDLVLALVASHGLCGQVVRGETPLPLLAGWVSFLRRLPAEGTARRAANDCLHLLNMVDTAAVREGLMTDGLLARIADVEDRITAVAVAGSSLELSTIECELADSETRLWQQRVPVGGAVAAQRSRLTDRLLRLRQSRIAAGEPESLTAAVVDGLPETTVAELDRLLRTSQFWYAEAGSAALSPAGQLKVLAIGLAAADLLPEVDTTRSFNISLQRLAARLGSGRSEPISRYRVRLIEALLASVSVADILAGRGPLGVAPPNVDTHAPPSAGGAGGLGIFTTPIGGGAAVVLDFAESREAAALLTLLAIYETKSSAAFHTTLKALCDLYGLRKDDFDRLANETLYLEHMNSARSDKSRMLDHVRPGLIVEVGPGGGVVLDLLEARFPESRVVGLDASRVVVETLAARRRNERRRWEIIEADAFRLPDFLEGQCADTVIFCSVLHEIYSYVEYPGETSDGAKGVGRFRLESVRDMLRSAYRALSVGGRIVVRDGVMPTTIEEPRVIRFRTPEAREFFELFARQFEGRPIRYEPVTAEPGPGAVRLSAADAMEFLFKLTWGPESFPYEIREQYGVLPYVEYRDRVLEWLADVDPDHPPRWVELPRHERCYLQPGYVKGLIGQVELLDTAGRAVELPDSNALWVYEKC